MPSGFWSWDFSDQLSWFCDLLDNAIPGPGYAAGNALAAAVCFLLDYWPALLALVALAVLAALLMRRL